MELFQRDHIRKNLSELQLLTDCHVSFISYLQSKSLLRDYDAECLKIIDNRFDKAAKFYEIIVDRSNSYWIVRDALKETVQTGAEAIFNQLEASPVATCSSALTLPDFESRIRKRIRYEVRRPVQLFTGRETEIGLLHEHMISQENDTRTTTVSGLGGIGKTELCRKYIERYSDEHYDGNVIWIQAEKKGDTIKNFQTVASDSLKIPLKNADGSDKDIETVVDDVYKYFEGKKVLFVFDNAVKSDDDDDDLDTFMPTRVTTKPAIIITSRDRFCTDMPTKMLVLGELKEVEAVGFVKKGLNIKNSSKDDVIQKLTRRLQHFPLAIQQAVSFIEILNGNLKTFGIDEYLNQFETNTAQLLDSPLNKYFTNKYTKTTYTTWKMTMNLISSEENFGKLSIKCLKMMAYFEPDKIPIQLFSLCEDIAQHSSYDIDSALLLLVQYSMINSQPTEKMLSIHRLVQEVIRIELKCEEKEENVLIDCLSCFLSQFHRAGIGHAKSVLEFSRAYPILLEMYPLVPSYVGEVLTLWYSKDCREFCKKWHEILSIHLPEGSVEIVNFECFFAQQLHQEKKHEDCLEALTLVFAKYLSFHGTHEFKMWRTNRFIAETLCELGRVEESLELAEIIFIELFCLPMEYNAEIRRTAMIVLDNYLMLGNFEGALNFCELVLDFVNCGSKCSDLPQNMYNGSSENERVSFYLKEIGNRITKLMKLNVMWTSLGTILANFHTQIGSDTDSLELVTTMYEFSKLAYGENNPNTVMCLVRKSMNYIKTKEYQKAFDILQNPLVEKFIMGWDVRQGNRPCASLTVFLQNDSLRTELKIKPLNYYQIYWIHILKKTRAITNVLVFFMKLQWCTPRGSTLLMRRKSGRRLTNLRRN